MRLILVLAVLLLGACAPSTMIEKFADDAKERIAQDYLQRLKAGDTERLIAELDPSLRASDVLVELNRIRSAFPEGTPTVTNLVGYQSAHTAGGSSYNLTYQFGYESRWLLANVAWRELTDGRREIVGMSARPLAESLQQTNALSLQRAGAWHYVFFAFAVTVPMFILATLVAAIRTKFQRRKWLWIIFILVGFVRFSINWTTGAMNVAPITFVLFGASAMAPSIYAPWIISFALPVGAIAFWIRRAQSRSPRQPTLDADAPKSDSVAPTTD